MAERKKARDSGRARIAFQMRSRRAVLGLSQEALADLAGVHRTYIGSIERCQQNISIDNIERIAGALNIDIADLLLPP